MGVEVLVGLAISAATAAANYLLTPKVNVNSEGASLEASQLTSSTEGNPINRVWGTQRLGGEVIWTTRFLETVTKTRQSSGKGAGGSQTTTEYTYSVSFAIALCEGETTLGKIYADGSEMDLSAVTYRFYGGSETQVPDSKIQAVEGAENVPAFRGVSYLVFEDLQIGSYGNRIPNITAEITRDVGNLDSVVEDICLYNGLTQDDLNITNLSGIEVAGFSVGSITTGRDIIQNLMQTYLFLGYESGSSIVFKPRYTSDIVEVELNDLISVGDGVFWNRERVPDIDLPDRTKVTYTNADTDYSQASVDGHMLGKNVLNVEVFESASVLEDDYARALADILTQEAWAQRDTLSIALPLSYLYLEPSDVFSLELYDVSKQYKIASLTIGDQINVEAVGYA